MAFDSLSEKLQNVFKNLRGKGRLTEADVKNRPMDIYRSSENFWYLELGGTEDTIEKAEQTKDRLIPLALGAWDYIKTAGNILRKPGIWNFWAFCLRSGNPVE